MLRAVDATRQRTTVFATELLLHSFPSADSGFRFAVAAAFDIVAEEQGVPSRRSGGVPGPTHRQRFSGQFVGARQITTVGDDVGPLAEECLELHAPAVLASHADRLLEQLDGSRPIAFSAPGAGEREGR